MSGTGSVSSASVDGASAADAPATSDAVDGAAPASAVVDGTAASGTDSRTGRGAGRAWAPLRNRIYRNLWLAVMVSNIGTYMQMVGAQWMLVGEPNASTLVALVQTASFLPLLLLAFPAGAFADAFDRRRLLLAVQVFLFVVAVVLTALTAADRMPPALLLALTFALGAGQALMLPAWQAIIPDLVPRDQLKAASGLGAISFNLARSVGPAIAGVLIAASGVFVVFAANALGFLVFALVLVFWRTEPVRDDALPERFTAAMRAGARYVRHSLFVRRMMLRTALFVVPGSAIWALLPLVASERLGFGSSGYGLLLAALGAGAIAGAFLLPGVQARLSGSQLVLGAGLVFGVALLVVALTTNPVAVTLILLPAGLAWITVMSTINATMQLFLPGWVRARGLSVYQIMYAGGQALGALAWGAVAQVTNLVVTYLIAGAVMIAAAATVRFWPMYDVDTINRDPAIYWPEPHLVLDPASHTGPVLITATYHVRGDRHDDFIRAMQTVRRSRQRTGATRWALYRAGESPDTFVEVYQVPTWEEHLRQHSGRLTGGDEEAERRARALVDGEPQVTHLLPSQRPS